MQNKLIVSAAAIALVAAISLVSGFGAAVAGTKFATLSGSTAQELTASEAAKVRGTGEIHINTVVNAHPTIATEGQKRHDIILIKTKLLILTRITHH